MFASRYIAALFGLLILPAFTVCAQSDKSPDSPEEAFALALAKAHAHTSLFTADTAPFRIRAEATSALALRATGKGVFEEERADEHHWRRSIRFPDFEASALSNDNRPFWNVMSTNFMPIRASELFRLSLLHIPGTAGAARYSVEQSSAVSDDGISLSCFSTAPSPAPDSAPKAFKWCFDMSTGLLYSEDLQPGTHVTFSGYIPFDGKQEFTRVHATTAGLTILDITLEYSILEPNALQNLTPSPGMKREAPAMSRPAPDEWTRGSLVNLPHPALPPGTDGAAANDPVILHFMIGPNGKALDASVEKAPTEAMAEAALKAASEVRLTPFQLDGIPTVVNFFFSMTFSHPEGGTPPAAEAQNSEASTSSAQQAAENPIRLDQLRKIFEALHLTELSNNMLRQQTAKEANKLPPWWPPSVLAEMTEKAEQVDLAPIDLPYYQKCYSEKDARFLIHLFEIPGGYAYVRSAMNAEAEEELQGTSPEDARHHIMKSDHGLSSGLFAQLDAEDRHQAELDFSGPRDAVMSRCIQGASKKATEAVGKAQVEAIQDVVKAHREDLDAAEARFDSEHRGDASPR